MVVAGGWGEGRSHLSGGQDISLIIFSTCSYSGCPGGSSPLGFSLPCWLCVPASLVAVFILRDVWGTKRQTLGNNSTGFHSALVILQEFISVHGCSIVLIIALVSYGYIWDYHKFQWLETAQMDLTGLTPRGKQGCVPFWNNPRRQSVSLPFASSRGCLHCLICASFQLQNQQWPGESFSYSVPLTLFCFPLLHLRTLWSHWTHRNKPGSFPSVKTSCLATWIPSLHLSHKPLPFSKPFYRPYLSLKCFWDRGVGGINVL